MELFKASQQWSTRPKDEIFSTIEDGYLAAKQYASTATEKSDVSPSTLRVEAIDGDVQLIGRGNVPAKLTNWAFGQVSNLVGAPASYLRKLPATLAAQNVNFGLANKYGTSSKPTSDDTRVNLLVHSNGSLLVRAFNSDRYSRIWNWELLERMRDFHLYGWTNPTPFATTASAHGAGLGDPTIYVSDHDMFVFQVNNDNRISEPGNPDGLGRGFFVENSEVGAAKLRVTTFLYRYMCSNHIVWGAKDVKEISVRHVGNAHDRVMYQFDALKVELKKYANSSASELEGQIAKAKSFVLASGRKDELLDSIFAKLRGSVTRTALEAGYDMASQHQLTDGAPNTAWGLAQGLTRYSQTLQYADARVEVDRAAGKLVEMAF